MIRWNLLAAAFGLGVAGCSYSSHTTSQATVPVPVVSASERACMDYGFTPGTTAYNRCVSRQAEVRALGRAPRGYAEDVLLADARQACSSYGLAPASAAYDLCLQREMDARRYRHEAVVTTTYVPSAPPPPPAGIEAFRDEYGYRYDGQGNRLDARGNIISPHSKTRY